MAGPSGESSHDPIPAPTAAEPPARGFRDAGRVEPPVRIAEVPGAQIGPYHLLHVIGEGGFGSVWMADQSEPVRRRVALKIIKLGMDTRQVVARFEQERQALAILDHPNIAKVFDAGATETGRPYFVMELCPGDPIDVYCDRNRLSIDERLKLFAQTCAAVQHAHTKGLIHRDIKPSNVLVVSQDGTPSPKVIDFGIAKATANRLTERTLFTEQQQLIGTLEYMSPEQAEGSLDIDTRSDVYSLGVLLYQLVTGATPFSGEELRSAAFGELQRIIREVDPPKPSTRLSQSADLVGVAERRRVETRRLGPAVRGELDWIVMKSLEKDRNRRYESATALARDVEHYLQGEAVVAAPPSAAYRFRKLVRRNRVMVSAGGAVAAALLMGAVAFAWQASIARDQRDEALLQSYSANVAAASASIDANEVAVARRRLDAAPASLRGWEWSYLTAQSDQSVSVISGDYDIRALAVSPDGTRIVLGAADSTVRLRAFPSGRELAVMRGHEDTVSSVAFHPDGDRIASASWDTTIRLWRISTGRELAVLRGHERQVTSVAFDSGGSRIASASVDGTVRIWDTESARETAALRGHDTFVNAVAFSPDGNTIASGSYDNTVRLWDVSTGLERAVLREHGHAVEAVAFSPDGRWLASGSRDTSIRVWDTSTGAELAVLQGHSGGVRSVAFSADGLRLATSSGDNTVRVWDAQTGRQLACLRGHEDELAAVAFTPDGEQLVSGSSDRSMRLWTTSGGQELAVLHHPHVVTWLDFSADGSRLATTCADLTVKIWDTASGEQIANLPTETHPHSVAFSPDGDRVAIAGYDDVVRILESPGSAESIVLRGHEDVVYSVDFSPDGQRVVSASGDGTLRLWSASSGDELAVLRGHEGKVAQSVFSADGSVIASAGDKLVRLWDAASGAPLATLAGHEGTVGYIALSLDGKRLASASADNSIRVWDVPRRRLISVLVGHQGAVDSVAFSPDGARIASGSSDQTVRVWDAASGLEVLVLRGHTGLVFSVAFSPDGTRLASGSMDSTVRIWDSVPYRERYQRREPDG